MDQIKLENQFVCWHKKKCRDDSNMGRDVLVPAHRISEVSVSTDPKHAAVTAATIAECV